MTNAFTFDLPAAAFPRSASCTHSPLPVPVQNTRKLLVPHLLMQGLSSEEGLALQNAIKWFDDRN